MKKKDRSNSDGTQTVDITAVIRGRFAHPGGRLADAVGSRAGADSPLAPLRAEGYKQWTGTTVAIQRRDDAAHES